MRAKFYTELVRELAVLKDPVKLVQNYLRMNEPMMKSFMPENVTYASFEASYTNMLTIYKPEFETQIAELVVVAREYKLQVALWLKTKNIEESKHRTTECETETRADWMARCVASATGQDYQSLNQAREDNHEEWDQDVSPKNALREAAKQEVSDHKKKWKNVQKEDEEQEQELDAELSRLSVVAESTKKGW